MTVLGSASAFPQTGANRSRKDLVASIAAHVSSSGSDILDRAAICFNQAIRDFNKIPWKFNRRVKDITITTSRTYTLDDTFRDPLLAYMLDSNSKMVGQPVGYMPWPVFKKGLWYDNFTSTIPEFYSVRDPHTDGLVTIWPEMGSTITYPTLHLEWHRRIPRISGAADRLDVPEEVEQAIEDQAVARLIRMEKGAREASGYFQQASSAELQVKDEHRDWAEVPVIGVRT